MQTKKIPASDLAGKTFFPLFDKGTEGRKRKQLTEKYGKALERIGAKWAPSYGKAEIILDFTEKETSLPENAVLPAHPARGKILTPGTFILLSGEFSLLSDILDKAGREKLALSYLSGDKTYPEAFETALRAYIRNGREHILPQIFKADDGAAMERYLSLFARLDLSTVRDLLDEARRQRLTDVTACLLNYRRNRFTPEEEAALEEAEMDKAMGFRDLNAKDWRKTLRFSIRGGCVRITGMKGEDTQLFIPAMIGRSEVTEIGDGAFRNTDIRQIELPDTLKKIGSEAFARCGRLESLTVPEGVTSIGRAAFAGMNCAPRRALAAAAGSPPISPYKKLTRGSRVLFGSWPEGEDLTPAPIAWRVMDRKNGRVLLLSEMVIDFLPYHSRSGFITWENSALRAYLNGTFLAEAFTNAERKLIRAAVVKNPDNHVYRTKGGRETEDLVFLPDDEQLQDFFGEAEERMAMGTPYALRLRAPLSHDGEACAWWLRLPGISGDFAAYVFDTGAVFYSGCSVKNGNTGIRPALWIEPEE